MDKSLPDLLIYALIFGAIMLFQYVMKRFAPQLEQQPQQDEPEPELVEDVQPFPAATPTDTRFGRSGAPEASSALARHRFSRRSLLGNRRDVQNAIVIATILGPCRAYEPHDSK